MSVWVFDIGFRVGGTRFSVLGSGFGGLAWIRSGLGLAAGNAFASEAGKDEQKDAYNSILMEYYNI